MCKVDDEGTMKGRECLIPSFIYNWHHVSDAKLHCHGSETTDQSVSQ